MMRSLYAGVSGLQNHQTRMDVIGNNVSNVNTTGFKKGRVNFQDLLSQNQKGAARPNERIGGVNPQQVGLGVGIAAIDTIHTQGSLQTTGVKTDLAIQGEGFFIMRNGDQSFYTRAGAFSLDENAVLVNPGTGLRVQGWSAQTVDGQTFINTAGPVGDLVIPQGGKDPAFATTSVQLASNLNNVTPPIPAGADDATIQQLTHSPEIQIFDSYGTQHVLRVNFTRDAAGAPGAWDANFEIITADGQTIVPDLTVGGVANDAGDGTVQVQFDNDGFLSSIANGTGGLDALENLDVQVSFQVPDTAIPADIDPDNVDPRFVGVAGDPITQTFAVSMGAVGDASRSTTQFSGETTNKFVEQDGYTFGYMQDYRIDQSGTITGIYTNGTNRPLGQVALASFTNPGGLEKAGDSTYMATINSGQADVAPAGLGVKGKLIAGALEMSNVDLAEQFTDMIVTQRGFQANSKSITTADQMLQELLTLKR